MARGARKHMKRVAAPSAWMLDKLTGVWAPKPCPGPHKQRECLPLIVLLRNRLKYALNMQESKMILIQRLVKVDGKVKTDHTYPAGLMDVVSLEKTKEHFRLLYDTKGRFQCHKITKEEAAYKLCRISKVAKGAKGVNYCTTHDGRTLRFPPAGLAAHDTIRLNLASGEIEEVAKFEHGNVCMTVGGNNIGRVGTLEHREKHPGSYEIVHLKDSEGHKFATRLQNVMVIGQGEKPWITLSKSKGIKLNNVQDRKKRMTKA